jgi:hypothetical protein
MNVEAIDGFIDKISQSELERGMPATVDQYNDIAESLGGERLFSIGDSTTKAELYILALATKIVLGRITNGSAETAAHGVYSHPDNVEVRNCKRR